MTQLLRDMFLVSMIVGNIEKPETIHFPINWACSRRSKRSCTETRPWCKTGAMGKHMEKSPRRWKSHRKNISKTENMVEHTKKKSSWFFNSDLFSHKKTRSLNKKGHKKPPHFQGHFEDANPQGKSVL
jgi:hypothetical protein